MRIRRHLLSLLAVLASMPLATIPASAAVAGEPCLRGGDTGTDGVMHIASQYWSNEPQHCLVSRIDVWTRWDTRPGRWELWGPRGYSKVIPSNNARMLTTTYPGWAAFTGELWCARFIRNDDGANLAEACLTVTS